VNESNQANHAKIGSIATGTKNLEEEEAPKTFRTTRRQECRVGDGGPGPGQQASPDDEDRESRHTTIPSLYVS
jgi:hypothetical protein